MTATSADGEGAGHWVVTVVGLAGGHGAVVEGAAEEVDGVALEPESEVDGDGDADVGVAEEFFDHDEFDALLQEQGGSGVP